MHTNGVTCWQSFTGSGNAKLLEMPELTTPTKLRREEDQVCVDDVTENVAEDVAEKVCWYWASVTQPPRVVRTPL